MNQLAIANELREALKDLASQKCPSVQDVLRRRGFRYEAGVVERVIKAHEALEAATMANPVTS